MYDYGFPECWKMIDFKMTDNNDGVVPIYKYYEKLMHFMLKFDLPDEETSYACASILLTMAIWRTNKQIFVFYKEMLEVLFEQKPDFNIPTEILISCHIHVFILILMDLTIWKGCWW